MKNSDYEVAIKIVVVGNGVVGKSSMIQRFCKGMFSSEYKKTLGVDFLEKIVRVRSENVRLMLWDTAGQEEFDAITKAYYRGAHACVIVFSVTDYDSFKSIERWKSKVEYECGEIPMALVMNKLDLINDGVVKREEVDYMAKKYAWKQFSTSVKDNINVDKVFQFLAESYIDSLNDEYIDEPVVPHIPMDSYSNSNKIPAITGTTILHPLFNPQYDTQMTTYKNRKNNELMKGYHYINTGFGELVNGYRYKSKLSVIPIRSQSQSNQSILLHHYNRNQYHYNDQLIHNNTFNRDYYYYNTNTTSGSQKIMKPSFFKTCRIF